jgi:CRISPR-associated protein Cas2
MTSIVRDRLWSKICVDEKCGGAVLVHTRNNEQGFQMQTIGDTKRKVIEIDGLQLVSTFNS